MSPEGRWAFYQFLDGNWEATGNIGYVKEADARAEVKRMNKLVGWKQYRLRQRKNVREMK